VTPVPASPAGAPPVPGEVSPGEARTTVAAEIELSIGGMTCAACAVRVEKKLSGLPDVRASVNYATATARVTAAAGMPVDVLTEAVRQAGYTAAARGGQASRLGTPPC
jgi:Cu+-exporting ATPase